MKYSIKRARTFITSGLLAFITTFTATVFPTANTYAENNIIGFSMSPLKENMILSPGESYSSSFTIFNPATNAKDFNYEVEISPFFVNENYVNTFTTEGDYNEIIDWITVNSPLKGSLAPNESNKIYFTIDVPDSAPAGGQYAAIVVSSATATNEGENTSAVVERTRIAHTIFAEITGNTIYDGEITNVSVPNFVLSGGIFGESTIENTGNVHSKATYTLEVSSLFSGETVYANVEEPDSHDILPGRTYYHKTTWDDTPSVGLYNVVYTVEFNGVKNETTKVVIVCPIWLLLIIVIAIIALVFFIFTKVNKKKRGYRATDY